MIRSRKSEQAAQSQARPEDDSGFERLFAEYWERIYRVLYRLTGCHAEAEDLALETFWRCWKRPPKDPSSLGGWLYRVATNLGYNALRSAKRRQGYETGSVSDPPEQTYAPNPAGAAEQADERRRVRDVLRKMNPRQAKLLVLRHSGLSYKEVADALGVSTASVGTLLVRAEKEFLKRYESEVSDAPER